MDTSDEKRGVVNLRRILVALICLIPLATIGHPAASGAWVWNHSAFISPDEFSYLLTGQNIAAGQGIELSGLDNFYPPGFPFLLAMWGKCFGFSLISMHVAVAVLQCLAIGAIFGVVRWIWRSLTNQRGNAWVPSAVILLYATNWNVLENTMSVLSEGAFTLAVFGWLAVGTRRTGWIESVRWTLVMALLAVAATAMRSAGIVCVALTLAWPWMAWWWEVGSLRAVARAYWIKALRATGIVGLIVVGWYGVIALASPEKGLLQTHGHNSYAMQLLGGFKDWTFFYDVAKHTDDWAQSFVPPRREPWRAVPLIVLGWGFLLLAAFGFVRRWWMQSRLALRFVDWFVVLYVGLYLIWPFHFARFWIPILPLMLVYAVNGLRTAPWKLMRRPAVAIGAAVVMIALSAWEIDGHFWPYATRIDYVTDCLAGSKAAIVAAGGLPGNTLLSNETFTFRYHTGLGQLDLPSPEPPGKAAGLIVERARAEGMVFVGSYFTPAVYQKLMAAVAREPGITVEKIYDADMVQVWAVRGRR